MTSSVVQVRWCDTKLRISPPIMKQCYWNLAGVLHPMRYARWYTFWCRYENMLGSPTSSKWNITIFDSIRQNAGSYLRRMLAPPSLGLLFNIFICIFCPVQLQTVIFNFKEEGTGTEHVAMATSKCVSSGIFPRVQYPCPVSIALLHYWWRYS